MKIQNIYHLLQAALLLLLVSCTQEEFPAVQDKAQQLTISVTDGGYTSAVENMKTRVETRAVENGYATAFTEGDACGLFVVRDGKVTTENIKLTATQADGKPAWTLPQGTTLYYNSADRYFLYYPYQETLEGTVAPTGTDDAAFFADVISKWQPKADQSDYKDGYTASDLMTAVGQVGNKDANGKRQLTFSTTHRMAMAVIEMPGTLCKFGDYPDIVYSTCPNPDFTGEAKPYPASGLYRYLVHPAAGGELTVSYDDNGTTREFAIPIVGNSLVAGSYKTYKVDGGTTIEEYASYAESGIVRIGDFYCTKDNGATGYLIPKEADASVVQAADVVGIVFQTDKSRIGAKEKEKLGGEDKVHGLVMALKDASTNQEWEPYGTDEGLTKCDTKAKNYNDLSGYGNCEHIRTNRGNFDNYPAFMAAYDYNTTCPVPATTTGWYLPASGQWWDILQNLGGCLTLADKAQQTSTNSDNYNFYWGNQGNVSAALNAWMKKIATDSKNNFRSGDWFWSSSEYSDGGAWNWCVGSSGVYCEWHDKYYSRNVRPVLAF